MSFTTGIARMASSLAYEDLPAEVINQAKECIRDHVAVGLAGTDRPPGRQVITYAREAGGTSGSTVYGAGHTSPDLAPLANGTLSSVLTYDDTFESLVIHPSSPVLPAILATAEQHSTSGQDIFAAYVAGVETVYRIGELLHPSHYRFGWHSTGTIGTFGAVAGVGNLLGCSMDEIRHGFGIAGSLSSTLRKNGGSDTFALHAGHAAQMGRRAMVLANSGVTGDPSIFEGSQGYLAVLSSEKAPDGAGEPQADPAYLGMLDIGFKAYPCARVPQAAMDGLRNIMDRQGLRSEDVQKVVARFDPSLDGILERSDPSDWNAARGSIEFCLAAILTESNLTIKHLTDDYLSSPPIQRAMEEIEPRYDEELADNFSKYGAIVTVETEATRYREAVPHPPGSLANPLSDARKREKFEVCARTVLDQQDATELYTLLGNFDAGETFGRVLGRLS